ncbi:hypothetical protein D3C75_750600 [compost metagenome]
MREDELLALYGLDPNPEYRDQIRQKLEEEIHQQDVEDHEYLKTLCVMLFCMGNVEDTQLIWQAKRKNQDTGSYIDVQLLCGAGYEETISYLDQQDDALALAELQYLRQCEPYDFVHFSKAEWVSNYNRYYGIS